MSTVLLPLDELLVLLVLLDELLLQPAAARAIAAMAAIAVLRLISSSSRLVWAGQVLKVAAGLAGLIAAVSPDGLLRPGPYAGG
jgi:hypothetical protein